MMVTAAQNKLEEIEQENKKAENDCSNFKCKWHIVKYDTKRPPAQISLVTGGLPYEQNN